MRSSVSEPRSGVLVTNTAPAAISASAWIAFIRFVLIACMMFLYITSTPCIQIHRVSKRTGSTFRWQWPRHPAASQGILPSKSRMTTMTRTKPNPPVGPYPQFRLCGQVGSEPSNIRTSSTTKTVPNIMIFSRSEGVQPTRQQRFGAV